MCGSGSSGSDYDSGAGGGGGGGLPYFCDGPFLAINTQDDIDQLSSCQTYSGNVSVGPSFDGPLEVNGELQEINGTFTCTNVAQLTSIAFNNLTSVLGSIAIGQLPMLSSMAFPALKRIVGGFSLQDLSDLSSLTLPTAAIDGDVDVGQMSNLSSIQLANLSSLTGSLTLQDLPRLSSLHLSPALDTIQSVIISNTAISNLYLPFLNSVSGINITSNQMMETINMSSLGSTGGGIYIRDLPLLGNTSLPDLTAINGTLYLENLPKIRALGFDRQLTSVGAIQVLHTALDKLSLIELQQLGSLTVEENPGLELTEISTLTQTTGTISAKDNGPSMTINLDNLGTVGSVDLQNIQGANLSALSNVTLSLSIQFSNIPYISAPALTDIGQNLIINDNQRLQSISMPELGSVSGGLNISDNNMLQHVDGFPALAAIGQNLIINDNKQLQSISMPELGSVSGELNISHNNILQHVDGFPALATIGFLELFGNFSSLSLPSLSDISSGVDVESNAGNASICRYINNLRHSHIAHGDVVCTPQPGLTTNLIVGLTLGSVLGGILVMVSTWREWALQSRQFEDNQNESQDGQSEQ